MNHNFKNSINELTDHLKLLEEMNELIYHLHLELESNSCLVPCEDGSASFVSTGAVNGFTSRLKRALRDEDYRHNLLNKFKEVT